MPVFDFSQKRRGIIFNPGGQVISQVDGQQVDIASLAACPFTGKECFKLVKCSIVALCLDVIEANVNQTSFTVNPGAKLHSFIFNGTDTSPISSCACRLTWLHISQNSVSL